MTTSPWRRRIERAEELASEYPFAGEILGFYIPIAHFHEDLFCRLSKALPQKSSSVFEELSPSELSALSSSFDSFFVMIEEHGPEALIELSRELRARGQPFWSELLKAAWSSPSSSTAETILALAFLQPYAELLRIGASLRASQHSYALCPFCARKPTFGALRPMGDGAARSLICSFCLAEWEFRRIVCPGCGEENEKKLAVFTATGFDYIRVECCDVCKTYIKSIDLTKNGRAEPLVDELASAPLDLWAHERGYAKLQTNILGM